MKSKVELEVELKIMLAEENVEFVKNWLASQKVLSQSLETLGNAYFDTPLQFFASQQWGLRVRSRNQQYEMTLKTKGEITGGLHVRPEYNLPLESAQPDFKRLNSHFNLQIENADVIADDLTPIFSTDFTRHKYLILCNQSQIEASLDLGWIKNPFGEDRICEVEFELVEGSVADILALLTQMPKRNGMWLSGLSKAQRGYLVGQNEKFKQTLSNELNEKTGEALAQAVAEYLRLFGENEAIRHYFKSADYLTQSLENLKRA